MFKERAPKQFVVQPEDLAEPRKAGCRAKSVGRLRIIQPLPVSPAAFERALERLNAHFDEKYVLEPMWELGKRSGGGIACSARHNRSVPGKAALRLLMNFDVWHPDVRQLVPKPPQFGPLASRKPSRISSHAFTFESDDEIIPWTEHDMVTVAGGICAALNWIPSGGLHQKTIAKRARAIRVALRAQAADFCVSRSPLIKQASSVEPLAVLWESCRDHQPQAPK